MYAEKHLNGSYPFIPNFSVAFTSEKCKIPGGRREKLLIKLDLHMCSDMIARSSPENLFSCKSFALDMLHISLNIGMALSCCF